MYSVYAMNCMAIETLVNTNSMEREGKDTWESSVKLGRDRII